MRDISVVKVPGNSERYLMSWVSVHPERASETDRQAETKAEGGPTPKPLIGLLPVVFPSFCDIDYLPSACGCDMQAQD